MRRFLYPHLMFAALAALAMSGCSSSGSGDHAEIRLLNVSQGYDSLDLYAAKDDESDTLELEGIGYETVSGYTSLDSGTYRIRLKRNGVTSTLQTLNEQQLADDSHRTYVTFGSIGQFGVMAIDDDQDEPDSGEAKIQVLNTAEAGSLDIYLTDEEDSLDDAAALFGSIGSGVQSGAATIDSGTYRLRVAGAGDTSDLRFDLSDVALDSESITALILTATEGGVLVNALFLPQRGELSVSRNTKARVRAANGISTGTAVTVRVGGTSLLSNATLGAIGGGYAQVEAGTLAVDVVVDGTAASSQSETLTAGADYTVLAWNDADGVRATLIGDDNRLPTTSGKAKLRLINGMSGLNEPINLSLNFAPIVEGVVLGTASSATEVDSGTDNELHVTNTNTGVSVLTRSSITLQSATVYTLFMSGDGAEDTTVGTLRRDR